MELAYYVVDVFTKTALEGNALAVFPDASALDANTMQRIAREFNLSETTFVLPPARVRIFTPNAELDFAGHPTIGTAYVMRSLGLVATNATSFTLDENIGPVNVRVDAGEDPMLWLTTPEIRHLGTIARAACAAAISLRESDLLPEVPCEIHSAGNPTLLIPVRDAAAVDRARVDSLAFAELVGACGLPALVFVFSPRDGGAYSRMFAPHLGVPEDPATGSATGPLAAFMIKYGLVSREDGARFVSEQGRTMGRRSLLYVLLHGDGGSAGIEIGGNVTPVATGRFTL
jgi:trans-2,3-dihydro-3-hydroxyanthranilate isomerase